MAVIQKWIREGRLSYYSLIIAFFLLPIWRNVFIIALWPWIFFWLLELFLNRTDLKARFKSAELTTFFLPALFVLLFLSILWSSNIDEGLNSIGRSVLLVIIPVIIGFDHGIREKKERFHYLLKSFVFGTLAALLILLILALDHSISLNDGDLIFNTRVGSWDNAFFYSAFSSLIHPTYFGMMVLLAAAICLAEIKPNNSISKSMLWPIIFSLCLLIGLFFISSRAMMVATVLVVAWYLVNLVSNRKRLIYILILVLTIFVSIAVLHPRLRRTQQLVTSDDNIPKYEQLLEISGRGNIWQVSFELIKENTFMGVGIGDVGDALVEKYRENGMMDESDRRLNCHNQFVEIWLATGILGLILLIALMIFPIIKINVGQKYLYGSFLIICTTGFLFESVLNRLWGVAFFSLFYSMLSNFPGETTISLKTDN